MSALGALVRTRRITRGWTLEHAAERMRLDLKHLQKIESGNANVTLATMVRIADAFAETFVLPLALGSGDSEPLTLRERTLSSRVMHSVATLSSNDPDVLVRDVGHRLAELRSARGWTQRELATAARVALGLVQRIEEGRYKRVALRTLARIGQVLGVGVRELMEAPTGPRPGRGRPPRMATPDR